MANFSVTSKLRTPNYAKKDKYGGYMFGQRLRFLIVTLKKKQNNNCDSQRNRGLDLRFYPDCINK